MKSLFKKIVRTSLVVGSVIALQANATIYLDFETNPLPLVDITAVIPRGFEATKADDVGAANVLGDVLEGGTATRNREAYLDRLADFGASFDVGVSPESAAWSLEYPLFQKHPVGELADLVAENWNTPRFTEESFQIAKTKLVSALKGGLDADSSMAATTVRRWVNLHDFGGFPVFLNKVEALTLAQVKRVYTERFQGAPDIWVGVIAPEMAKDQVKLILSKVFSRQGKIKETRLKESLVEVPKLSSNSTGKKRILLISKPGRQQAVTVMMAVSEKPVTASGELDLRFGEHVLTGNGLGSVWGEEIRTKRGLAYAVGGVAQTYRGRAVMGVSMNPQTVKIDEALKVASDLIPASYENGKLWSEFPKDAWASQLQSFRYSRILELSSPEGRIEDRMNVVLGLQGLDFSASNPETWNPTPASVADRLKDHWKTSAVTMAIVGNEADLKPMLEKHFPGYEIHVIPFEKTILEDGYKN